MSKKLTLTTGESFEINEAQWNTLIKLYKEDTHPETIVLQGNTIEWNAIIGLELAAKSMYERMVDLNLNMDWYKGKLQLTKEYNASKAA